MKKKNYFTLILVFVFCLLFLTACSQKVSMSFYKNGRWRVNNEMIYSKVITDLTGGLLSAFGLDLGSNSLISDLTQSATALSYNMAKNLMRQQGIEMDWSQKESGNNVVVQFVLEADSYQQFNNLMSIAGGSGIEDLGDGSYRLRIDYQTINEQYYDLFGLSDISPFMETMGMLNNVELEITTGRIISSNADKIRGQTAIWYNPSYVDIIFTPRRHFHFSLCIIPLALFASIIFVITIVKRQRQSSLNSNSDFSGHNNLDDFFNF